jgi:UDP-N-acetyl-D-glucosamine dehydrogenase
MSHTGSLVERLKARSTKAGVIGLGYVGLPLAIEFAKAGLTVVGVDLDTRKVEALSKGESYILDVAAKDVADMVKAGRFRATTDFSTLSDVDTINICVPTPLRKTKDPDLSYIVASVEEIAKYFKAGQLIILESTTYPGTTDEVVQPMLEAGGLKAGTDFFLAFSPERVDPGNPQFHTGNIPKVVGGVNEASTQAAAALYGLVVKEVVQVSSTRAAELVKLLENTFRAVNIGMVNELALMCRDHDVDVWEVIEAAATKPYGYMQFMPGPGIGGHCIPIDPLYLSWKLKTLNYRARFIELAGEVNSKMPDYVCEVVADALNDREKSVKGSKVLVLGVTYKRDIEDVRESPALDIIKILEGKGARVSYNDPYVPELHLDHSQGVMRSQDLIPSVRAADVVVIVTDHSSYPYREIVEAAPVVVDTRNATKGIRSPKIVKI